MKSDDTWVVIADGQGARTFKTDAEMQELVVVSEVANRQHAAAHRRGGANPDSGHDEEEARFARQLAHELDQADHQHKYRELVIAAPARFLGFLRQHLKPSTAARVAATLNKDLTREEVHALAGHLRKLLADRHIEDAR